MTSQTRSDIWFLTDMLAQECGGRVKVSYNEETDTIKVTMRPEDRPRWRYIFIPDDKYLGHPVIWKDFE